MGQSIPYDGIFCCHTWHCLVIKILLIIVIQLGQYMAFPFRDYICPIICLTVVQNFFCIMASVILLP